MNDQQKAIAAAGGVVALGAGYLLTQENSAAEAAEQLPLPVPEEAVDTVESWRPAYEDAEWGISDNGVIYDDPEDGGEHDDEAGDDANTSFETIEEESGGAIDAEETAENYAPDTQDGSTAPDSGVISDPGDSQNWGDAPEQENDDLTERSAESEMDDDLKSSFDRLANYDDPDQLDDGGSSSTSSTSSTSDSDSDDSGDSWADSYDGGSDGLTIDENNDAGYTAPEW